MQIRPFLSTRLFRPSLAWTIAVTAIVVAIVGAIYSTQSLFLGVSLAKALPRNDQWLFVEEYFRYLDGNDSLFDFVRSLFARLGQDGEYRPLTIRLALYADAAFFRMGGMLPVYTMYATLAATAYLTALVSAGRSAGALSHGIGFAILLGLAWSIAQFENLSWGFQVGVVFAHFFALVCYSALALSLTQTGARSRVWLSLAIAADSLAVFSQGLGPLTVLPALAIAFWLRAVNLKLLIFVLFHILFSVPSLHDLAFADVTRVQEYFAKSAETLGALAEVLEFVAAFLTLAATSVSGLIGLSFTNFTGTAPIDKLALGTFAGLVAAATWLSAVKRRPVDVGLCVLLAACSFVFLEAAAVALARGYLAGRHATPSALFIVFLLGAAWRLTLIYRADLLQLPVLGLAAAALMATNASAYETEWRYLADCIDQETLRLTRQSAEELPCAVEQLTLPVSPETKKRYLQMRLGPIADQ